MELTEIKLEENELTEKKLDLLNAEILRDETDLSLAEMQEQLENQIPNKMFKDELTRITRALKEGVNDEGIPVEEGEREMLEIRKKFIKKTIDKDLPLRKLRLKVQSLHYSKGRMDAPEQQINKLKKEIRSGFATVPVSRVKRPVPAGVG